MNPSVFYQQFADRTWYCVKWPNLPGSYRSWNVLCSCCIPPLRVLSGNPTSTFAYKVEMRFIDYRNEHHKVTLGVGQCDKCGDVHWTCDDLHALIKLCEAKAAGAELERS